MECQKKWTNHVLLDPYLPCGQCPACQMKRKLNWKNYLELETATNDSWPIFYSLTYAEEPSLGELADNIKRFWKRHRNDGIDVRYFVVTERGTKDNRLHHHCVAWVPAFNSWSKKQIYDYTNWSWFNGYVYTKRITTRKVFGYVCKYVNKGALYYTWSKRPMLGYKAKEAYLSQIEPIQKRANDRYEKIIKVPGFYTGYMMNELVKIRVPESWYRS